MRAILALFIFSVWSFVTNSIRNEYSQLNEKKPAHSWGDMYLFHVELVIHVLELQNLDVV